MFVNFEESFSKVIRWIIFLEFIIHKNVIFFLKQQKLKNLYRQYIVSLKTFKLKNIFQQLVFKVMFWEHLREIGNMRDLFLLPGYKTGNFQGLWYKKYQKYFFNNKNLSLYKNLAKYLYRNVIKLAYIITLFLLLTIIVNNQIYLH